MKAKSFLLCAGAVVSLGLVGSLAGCGPHYGYTNTGYAGKGLKDGVSAPMAKPQAVGGAYSEQMNAESAEHWRVIADDLVGRMAARTQFRNFPIYVRPQGGGSPFHTVFDNFLREALLDAGFEVTAEPLGGPIMAYDAKVVKHDARRDHRLHPGAWIVTGKNWKMGVAPVSETGSRLPETAGDTGKSSRFGWGHQGDAAYQARMMKAPFLMSTDTEVVVNITVVDRGAVISEETGVYYVQNDDHGQYEGKSNTKMLSVIGE